MKLFIGIIIGLIILTIGAVIGFVLAALLSVNKFDELREELARYRRQETERKKEEARNRQLGRIRKMSIDELAEFLYSAPDKVCFENCLKDTGNKFSCKFGENVDSSNCIKCMKHYLESEVTE